MIGFLGFGGISLGGLTTMGLGAYESAGGGGGNGPAVPTGGPFRLRVASPGRRRLRVATSSRRLLRVKR